MVGKVDKLLFFRRKIDSGIGFLILLLTAGLVFWFISMHSELSGFMEEAQFGRLDTVNSSTFVDPGGN